MSECIFCSIVEGDVPSRTVYETDEVLAFLDVNPLAEGHTLVIPKAHHERLTDMPESLSTEVMDALYRVTGAVEAAVDAEATTIAFNNGEAAGQEVPHVHGHVIPRWSGDGGGPIHAVAGRRPELGEDELDDVAERIAGQL